MNWQAARMALQMIFRFLKCLIHAVDGCLSHCVLGGLLTVTLWPSVSVARVVELRVSPGMLATADYQPGTLDAAPILLLHGFLQTRNFSTVARLGDELRSQGLTVLAPTLSLGVSLRKEPLACEAVHTHSLDDDLREINLWVNWLRNTTGRKPVLIGHSAGARFLLSYMGEHPLEPVDSAILIGLNFFHEGPAANETVAHAQHAEAVFRTNPAQLDEYALSYCKRYPTTAAAFLSYFRLNKQHTLKALQAVTYPTTIILGSADQEVDQDWHSMLVAHGARVIEIEGANHFFDQNHEFDLLETVENILHQTPQSGH